MSTKYNHFAKELDAAFRTARSEYAAVYDELTKAKENASAAGLDAVKKQIATLQLQELQIHSHFCIEKYIVFFLN